MPATKRARKVYSPPPEPEELPSFQVIADSPARPPSADDLENDLDEVGSNADSALSYDSVPSIDPALADEEEGAEPEVGTSTGASKDYIGRGYNAVKTFKGQVYTGMAIGGSHTWNYDQGVWKETKEEPDLWKIDFKTNKRRAKNAPKGSGAPVGTEYHWLIVAHQHVKKIDANTYETHLVGSKYKLAHMNANSKTWSIPDVKSQREREVEVLEDAKRRVQGLPPVMAGEKVKVVKHEKGQQKLDSLFGVKKGPAESSRSSGQAVNGKKRKRAGH